MAPIIATIQFGNTGPQVANLQNALLALLEHRFIQPLPAPYVPTREELQRLTESLQPERAQSLFGKATRQLVSYFQGQQDLDDNLGGAVEDKTAARLNELLKSIGALDNPEPTRFVVRGHVTGASKDRVVRAYDKDFRSEELLGESSIDPQGNYEIRYDAALFQRAEKGTADLRVAVCGPGGRELVSSDILFNAGPETTIDLTAGPESEYERYLADLEPVLQPVALIDIDGENAEDQRKDLDFLAGDTGIDRQHIAWLVRAAGFEVKSKRIDLEIRSAAIDRGIPAAAFYAWFREGIPDQWDALVAEPIDKLRTALLAAIKQDTIGAEFRTRIEAILDAMPSR